MEYYVMTGEQKDKMYAYFARELEIDNSSVELNDLLDILDGLKQIEE